MNIVQLLMILTAVEMQDKFDGSINKFVVEMLPKCGETAHCQLASVRFFHKRNSCECLKEVYSKLKKSTVRKARCYHCHELKDSSEVHLCSRCKVVLYCSRDCQVADFPRHKKACKHLRDTKKMDETDSVVSSFGEIDLS